MNYTFGKAMGIVNHRRSTQFNLDNNYGVQAGNRNAHLQRRVLHRVGQPRPETRFAGGFVNGWQLSGITQTAERRQPHRDSASNANFGMNLNSAKIPGTDVQRQQRVAAGDAQYPAQPDADLQSDRRARGRNQYINPSCFSIPTAIGQNGPTVLPAIYGPAFFNSDLGLFKNFQFKESKKLQLRFNGYNFLNHPLWSFNGSNLTLGFDREYGQSQYAVVRHGNSEAGPSHHPGGDQVLLLIAFVAERQARRPVSDRAGVSPEASALFLCRAVT